MKYKIQQTGVLDTETDTFIPASSGNRHWQEYLEWVVDGNIADPEFTLVEINIKALDDKIQGVKTEGLSRIQLLMPGITDFDTLELVREMWLSTAPAARSATATFQEIINIYQAARAGVIYLKSAIDEDVASYDIVTDPSWPA